MRVAQIIDGLRLAGGAERLQLIFAEEMAARPDVDLTVITLRESRPDAVAALAARGARLVALPAPSFASPGRALRLLRLLRRESFDVVHTHLVRATILGVLAGKLAGIRTVATLHNTRASRRLPASLRTLESAVLRRAADRVIAVGWETARAHRERLGARPIEVIPNAVGAPSALSPAERARLRASLGVAPDELLVISVGRLHPQKAVPELLRAFAEVVAEGHPVQLRIAGDGALEASLRAEVERLGLASRAKLLGVRRDVHDLLAASDVYASASAWEGLPVATLEAMAAGLPIVATAVGDVPRIVDAEVGTLVPPGEPGELARALSKTLCDPALRRAQGEAARVRVRRDHCAAAWADRLLALYAEPLL